MNFEIEHNPTSFSLLYTLRQMFPEQMDAWYAPLKKGSNILSLNGEQFVFLARVVNSAMAKFTVEGQEQASTIIAELAYITHPELTQVCLRLLNKNDPYLWPMQVEKEVGLN